MILPDDADLLYIAEEGLKAPELVNATIPMAMETMNLLPPFFEFFLISRAPTRRTHVAKQAVRRSQGMEFDRLRHCHCALTACVEHD